MSFSPPPRDENKENRAWFEDLDVRNKCFIQGPASLPLSQRIQLGHFFSSDIQNDAAEDKDKADELGD